MRLVRGCLCLIAGTPITSLRDTQVRRKNVRVPIPIGCVMHKPLRCPCWASEILKKKPAVTVTGVKGGKANSHKAEMFHRGLKRVTEVLKDKIQIIFHLCIIATYLFGAERVFVRPISS